MRDIISLGVIKRRPAPVSQSSPTNPTGQLARVAVILRAWLVLPLARITSTKSATDAWILCLLSSIVSIILEPIADDFTCLLLSLRISCFFLASLE